MLKHTQKIKEIYEDIQKKIFYMIPEKWDSLYLYSSVIEEEGDKEETGELFFYYVPKGILKKKPVNVYEIPSKFNIDEKEYLKLVEALYNKIKELRQQFKRLELKETWSNLTIIIHNLRFMVEYNYEDLKNSALSSYERHIIWRCQYLGITLEQLNKEEKAILKKYATGPKTLVKTERYNAGIYIKDVQNTVDYGTQKEDTLSNIEDQKNKKHKTNKNQILSSMEDEK